VTELNTKIEWRALFQPEHKTFPGWFYEGELHNYQIRVYRRGQDMCWHFTIGIIHGKRKGFYVYRSEFDSHYIAPTDIHEVLLLAVDRIFVAVAP
jgi:hypothetical protein